MTAKQVKFSEIQVGDAFLVSHKIEIEVHVAVRVKEGIKAITGPVSGQTMELSLLDLAMLNWSSGNLIFSVVGNRSIAETCQHVGEPVPQ